MPELEITASTMNVRCTCGEVTEFDDIHDGWQHIIPCDCGKYLSLQIDPIVQFDSGRISGEVSA